jgi:hypothetical protein
MSRTVRWVAGVAAALLGGGLTGITCGSAMVNDRATLSDVLAFALGLGVLVGGFVLAHRRPPRRTLAPAGEPTTPACEPGS